MSDRADSERALMLVPHGRDAVVATQMLAEASIEAKACASIEAWPPRSSRRRLRARHRGSVGHRRRHRAGAMARRSGGMVGPAVHPADHTRAEGWSATRRPRATSACSATSPSLSARSIPPRSSAWRRPRCAADAANMRRARGSRNCASSPPRWRTASAPRTAEREPRAGAAARGAEAGDAGPADRRRRA